MVLIFEFNVEYFSSSIVKFTFDSEKKKKKNASI